MGVDNQQYGYRGYFQPNSLQADFAYWAKNAKWTIPEAASLIVGLNPLKTSGDNLDYGEVRAYRDQILGLLRLAKRAVEEGHLENPATPASWIAWAVKNDLPLPAALKAEVEKWSRPDAGESQDGSRVADLEKTVADLKSKLAERRSTQEGTIGTRERDSMLKLIIGMAVKGYGYDPSDRRSDSVPEIASDLASAGIPLDAGTVRKYLREAAELLPPVEGLRD